MKSIFLYVLLATLLMTFWTAGGMKLSWDSMRYVAAGDLFCHGKFQQGLDSLFPDFPPFYSLVLGSAQCVTGGLLRAQDRGAVGGKGFIVRSLLWVRLVSISCFALTVSGLFLLGWYLGKGFVAHLSASLALVFPPLVNLFTWVWSETVFLPISIFCILALLLYTRNQNTLWLLCSAILAAFAFFTRFMGITLVLSAFLIVLFVSEDSKKLIKIIPWVLIACSPLLSYLGIDRPATPSQHGLFYQALEFLKVSLRDFTLIGLLVLVLLLVLRVLRWRDTERVFIWWGVPLYVLTYSVTLIVVKSIVVTDPIDSVGSRLLVPIYPFLLLLVSLSLKMGFRSAYAHG